MDNQIPQTAEEAAKEYILESQISGVPIRAAYLCQLTGWSEMEARHFLQKSIDPVQAKKLPNKPPNDDAIEFDFEPEETQDLDHFCLPPSVQKLAATKMRNDAVRYIERQRRKNEKIDIAVVSFLLNVRKKAAEQFLSDYQQSRKA